MFEVVAVAQIAVVDLVFAFVVVMPVLEVLVDSHQSIFYEGYPSTKDLDPPASID